MTSRTRTSGPMRWLIAARANGEIRPSRLRPLAIVPPVVSTTTGTAASFRSSQSAICTTSMSNLSDRLLWRWRFVSTTVAVGRDRSRRIRGHACGDSFQTASAQMQRRAGRCILTTVCANGFQLTTKSEWSHHVTNQCWWAPARATRRAASRMPILLDAMESDTFSRKVAGCTRSGCGPKSAAAP